MRKKALLPIMVALAAIVLLGCKNPVTSSTDTVINLAAIAGVTAPATGGTPVTSIEGDQYTGSVSWSPSVSSTFIASTVYTATITLTPKSGYTLTGVAANSFTVTGASSITNNADSGVVTAVFPETATDPDLLSATSYFKTTPGFGIRYHVTDDYSNLDIYAWAVSQNFTSGLPNDLNFVFTLNRENTGNLDNSLGGKLSKQIDGKNYLMFYAGSPSSNQGNFYMNLMIPVKFKTGMTWTIDTKTYTVASPESITLGSDTLNNCQRINIVDSDTDSYLGGNGYFLLAENIGIVKIEFNRSNGTQVLFTYDSSRQLTSYTLSGTVFESSGIPAVGKYVQISNENWGTRSVSDADGNFSLQCYGPDIVLRIGEDADSNNVLDYSPSNNPKEYWVNSISSNKNNLSIDLSSL